jgi:hypothetical protein
MPAFSTLVVDGRVIVDRRLADWGLAVEQFVAIADVARRWAEDAGPLMPLNAPGTLAYIYGVNELRRQLVGGNWIVDRTCGIEAVVNREIGIRIGYQNVDVACDQVFAPTPRSAKGSAAESMCGPNLFEYAGIDVGPLTGVKQDGIPTYYVMVGEDGRVELSHPVIKDGAYRHFHERIFISGPAEDWADEIDPANAPMNDFDVAVSFKNGM